MTVFSRFSATKVGFFITKVVKDNFDIRLVSKSKKQEREKWQSV